MRAENLGAALRKQMKLQRLTQTQLAHAVGVTQVAISNWSRGKRYPACETLVKLPDVLGCTLDDLFKDEA